MAGRQDPCRHAALHERRQLEKALSAANEVAGQAETLRAAVDGFVATLRAA